MRGSLERVGPNHWRLRVYAGQRTAAGNPKMLTKQFRGGERAARSALAKFVTQTLAQDQPEPDNREDATVAELMARWMEHQSKRCTPYTMDDYRSRLARHILPALGTIKLGRLSPAELDRAYDGWLGKGLAPATVRKNHNMVAAALRQAVKWGWLRAAPTDRADPPKVQTTDRGTIPLDELKALMVEAEIADGPGGVLPTAIALGALTGCRRGELCALRWSDVSAGKVTVRRALTVTPSTRHEGPTKTGKSKHLALDVVALEALARRREEQEREADLHGDCLVADPYVLSRDSDGSTPCLPDGLTHGFGRLVERLWPRTNKASEPRWHFHDLRHWTATALIGAGIDIKTSQARLGHATTAMLLDRYAHAITDGDVAAAEVVGVAFRG
jgi:integrase